MFRFTVLGRGHQDWSSWSFPDAADAHDDPGVDPCIILYFNPCLNKREDEINCSAPAQNPYLRMVIVQCRKPCRAHTISVINRPLFSVSRHVKKSCSLRLMRFDNWADL